MNKVNNINYLYIETEKPLLSDLSVESKDYFIVAEVDGLNSQPIHRYIKQDALSILIITQGNISAVIDQENYIIGPNTVIRTIPEHLMRFVHVSNDFLGKIISVNRDLLNLTTSGISPNTYLYIRQNPVFELTQKEIDNILELFNLIKAKVEKSSSDADERVFHCLIMALYYELTGCINKRIEERPAAKLSHKENLYKRFLTLLRNNIREQHSVTFYANQLCLTPQYISSILKELSGMTANKWIDEMLLAEAKLLLFSTENNIQQIADKLNFPDQSSFGKFFKKMTGMSPSNFKKSKGVH